jgi:hypothetical protein
MSLFGSRGWIGWRMAGVEPHTSAWVIDTAGIAGAVWYKPLLCPDKS